MRAIITNHTNITITTVNNTEAIAMGQFDPGNSL